MSAHDVVIVAMVLIGIWVLWRWGALIFTAYALWHFCAGDWTAAALAAGYVAFLAFVRGFASWLDWIAFGRDEWRQLRETR